MRSCPQVLRSLFIVSKLTTMRKILSVLISTFVLSYLMAAVDNETEAALQRSIQKISNDRTTLIVAHRLSTIRNADEIIVLDNGKIVEKGTHDSLLNHNGVYAKLWSVQTGSLA